MIIYVVVVVSIRRIVIANSPGGLPDFLPFSLILAFERTARGTAFPSVGIIPFRLVFCQQLISRLVFIGIHVSLHALCIEHIAHLAAAIGLIDISPRLEVHLGIFGPGVQTLSGTKDCAIIAVLLEDGHGNIHRGVDGAAHIVVATIDAAVHTSIAAAVVHVRFIDIAWRKDMIAVGTTEDVVDLDGRTRRHIHHGATGDALVQAAAVSGANSPSHQVDDGRGLNGVEGLFRWGGLSGRFGFLEGLRSRIAHAKSVVGTGTEHLCRFERLDILGDVNQHIAVILRLVAVTVAGITLAGTEQFGYFTLGVGNRAEIDERVVQIGLSCVGDA